MFKSATLKLTLWYVLMAMALSVAFSLVLYNFGTSEIAEGLNSQYKILNEHGDHHNITESELNDRSSGLARDLIYFNLIVLLGSGLASYLLAKRTLKPIEAAHQAQIRFTAEASHELRTPLAAMRADTEASLLRLKSEPDPLILRQTLEENLLDIEKLDKLTSHLLDVSRYDSKKITASDEIEFQKIVAEVVAKQKRRLSRRHIKVEIQTEPVQVKGELQGLNQMVTIILDNAIKYSLDGGNIFIGLNYKNKRANLTIQDEGIGIQASDLSHVFEHFYRAKSASGGNHRTVGYGLGLPLAKDIVELHKGTISIKGRQPQGTTVIISLPGYRQS